MIAWLVELVVGILVKWGFKKAVDDVDPAKPPPSPELTKATAEAANEKTDLNRETTREQVTQAVDDSGTSADRQQLRDDWTDGD